MKIIIFLKLIICKYELMRKKEHSSHLFRLLLAIVLGLILLAAAIIKIIYPSPLFKSIFLCRQYIRNCSSDRFGDFLEPSRDLGTHGAGLYCFWWVFFICGYFWTALPLFRGCSHSPQSNFTARQHLNRSSLLDRLKGL